MFFQYNLSFLKSVNIIQTTSFFLSKQSDLHGQMMSSLKDNFRSDNLTTGTTISNEWNHLFMDVSECKTFQSHTLNLLSKTFVLFNISV